MYKTIACVHDKIHRHLRVRQTDSFREYNNEAWLGEKFADESRQICMAAGRSTRRE